jgi:hypothetical protein
LGGEVGGEFEADLLNEADGTLISILEGGDVGGEFEADLPDEADGALIFVLDGESGRDLLVHCKIEASSSPAINSSPSGVSGGESDIELFNDFGAEMGLRAAASEMLRRLVGQESKCELDNGLACNNVSSTKDFE